MIHGFPIPYPDELFYSLLARREAQMGYPSYKGILREVFGCTGTVVAFEFPSHLGHLMKALHHSHPCSAFKFLEQLTLLPWYAPFLPLKRSNEIRAAMLANGGCDCWNWAGITPSRVQRPGFLRYCPECLREDKASGKIPYWRRLHQMAGIELCPNHQVLLEDSAIHRQRQRYRYLLPPESILNTPSRPPELENESLGGLARLGQELLSREWPNLSLQRLRETYLVQLRRTGYVNGGGNVKMEALLKDLQSFYGDGFLQKLGCRGQHWLVRMLRRSFSIQQPIRHLLLVNFIGISLVDFFSSKNIPEMSSTPLIVRASIQCVNFLCPHCGENTAGFVREEKSRMLGGMIETYRCEVCGQLRRRCTVGHDRTWVGDFGDLWRARLAELWADHTLSLSAIAAALHASFDATRRAALKMGLPLARPGRKTVSVRSISHLLIPKAQKRKQKLKALRAQWLENKRQNRDLGMRGLRELSRATYATLNRYDREWLLAHRPPRKTRKSVFNWDNRDREICRKIELASNRMPSMSPSKLAHEVGLKGWISDHLSRLPRARQTFLRLTNRKYRSVVKSATGLGNGAARKPWREEG